LRLARGLAAKLRKPALQNAKNLGQDAFLGSILPPA
jgi:hypothetical protein